MKTTNISWADLKASPEALVPVIVQRYSKNQKGKILMFNYVNKGAFDATLETGFAHFWSRSRQKFWKKGETSGNTMTVKEIWVNYNKDTLIFMVIPKGAVDYPNPLYPNAKKISGFSRIK